MAKLIFYLGTLTPTSLLTTLQSFSLVVFSVPTFYINIKLWLRNHITPSVYIVIYSFSVCFQHIFFLSVAKQKHVSLCHFMCMEPGFRGVVCLDQGHETSEKQRYSLSLDSSFYRFQETSPYISYFP